MHFFVVVGQAILLVFLWGMLINQAPNVICPKKEKVQSSFISDNETII